VFESHTNRLLLANHTLKQLNIIDDNNYSGKHSSVAKMLNNAITTMGKRKFAHTLLSPITNEDQLNIEYDITEYLLHNEHLVPRDLMNFSKPAISPKRKDSKQSGIYTPYDTIKTMLVDIKDLTKYMRQIIIKKISPKAFYQMYKNMQTIVELCDCIKLDTTVINYLLYHHIDCEEIIDHCNVIMQYFESHFSLEICKSMDTCQNFECNFINKGISNELDTKLELMNESDDMFQACKNFFNDALHKYEKNTKHPEYIKIHETEKTNFTLVSTKRRCKLLQTALAQLYPSGSTQVHYMSTSNGCMKEFTLNTTVEVATGTSTNDCITNSQIKELCKHIGSAKVTLKDIINRVYLDIVGNTSLILPRLESIIHLVSTVDIIYAKMMVAKKYNFCKPSIVGTSAKSFINVKGLRHCLIEQLNTNELYVANDISLGQDTDGILLYGTNAVGKTSFIRAIGVAVILAQSGLYVPATEFCYKPYQSIFTRIIGNDNIFKGLSTFAVEMTELRNILRLMNQNSLILGDELCSGTESVSAVSIFVAGMQRMYQAQSSFIFATHLHEIVHYEEIENMTTVQLKHMEVMYDKEKGVLIYDRKLKDGPGQSMYGLEVCKSLNLPPDFLQSAYEIRLKYHPESNSVMDAKTTHFNKRKIKSALCEICKKEAGAEIHHLQHQQDANEDDIITNDGYTFHKNHPANLVTVCEKCHNKFHDSDKQHVRVKTSVGTIIKEL
jgi:DNA mismatch repair protein MutS